VVALGVKCGLSQAAEVLHLTNLCNRVGIDTVSTGASIAFAMDLFERGILTVEDTGGFDLSWGHAESMELLIRQITRGEGVGGVLAKGVRRAARSIGRGSEKYAYHVKGLELTAYDPRTLMGTALGYTVSSRGGDFTQVYASPEYKWSPERAAKELGSAKAVDRFSTEGKGALIRRCMIVSAVVDSLGICKVPALSLIGEFDLKNEAELVQALTGWPVDASELIHAGERILNLEKLFNLRHGELRNLDTLPDRFINEPVAEEGPAKGKVVDLRPMVADFYRAMGWDEEGIPGQSKLASLGLDTLSIKKEVKRENC
jgi:aldehyde:ferredoxin oxidoreductase